ncbi:hypothetical protein GCM10010439_46920 [Actinocorallia aurantiaca]|uniref:HEPN domain-containing protein n=2 Tax=Actinocorallia aurantiaca TaxID=46204 RepID=A0ABP6GUD1_9ACTN
MGVALRSLDYELLERSVVLANAYPRSGPPGEPAQLLAEASETIRKARRMLEDALYEEHPRLADTSVYGGTGEVR